MPKLIDVRIEEKEFDECFKASVVRGIQARKQGCKYIIEVKSPVWKGFEFSLGLQKEYGDVDGCYTGAKDVADALAIIRRAIKRWEGYDGILGRLGDKVTERSLFFWSFSPKITKAMVLHQGQIQLFAIAEVVA